MASASWLVEAGEFELRVGASSRDVRGRATVTIESTDRVTPVPAPAGPVATTEEFAALLGRPVPAPRPLWPLHLDSSIDDLGQSWLGSKLRGLLLGVVSKQIDVGQADEATKAMFEAVIGQMPLRGLVANAGGKVSFETVEKLLAVLNRLHRKS